MIRMCLALTGVAALAACGGSGGSGDGGDDGGIGVLSTGALQDVEVPSADDLAGLPQDVQDLVNDFVTANETLAATTTRPTGTASFEGNYGFGFDDADNETVVIGDMRMTANFDTGIIDGTVSNLTGTSPEGTLTISNDLDVSAVIDNTADIAGTVGGDVELEGETYGFSASIAGTFAGDTAGSAIGTTEGLVTNPDNSVDSISGYFLTEQR